jgi:hypothetical protein
MNISKKEMATIGNAFEWTQDFFSRYLSIYVLWSSKANEL